MLLKHTPVTQRILCLIFFQCIHVATMQQLNYGEQESLKKKKKIMQLTILTHLWPWNKVKINKPGINW